MNKLPTRKRIRLPDHDYSQPGCYFITICVKNGHQLLGTIVGDAVLCVPCVILTQTGQIVQSYLEKMDTTIAHVCLERYVIMPNHVHLLVVIQDEIDGTQRTASPTGNVSSPTKATIPRIVHGLKAAVTRETGVSIWQRSYHEHVVRDEKTYLRICQYIDENPQKWAQDCYYTQDV